MSSFFSFQLFSPYPQLRHYISNRNGGVSKSPYDTFNLSTHLHDDILFVNKNRAVVSTHLQVDGLQSFFPQQTHSNNIKMVTSKTVWSDLLDTDALITATPNIGISVLAADCVPILLYDFKSQVIAAIHAGWKGTVAKIVEKTILEMRKEFGCQPSHIIAGIGPSISMKHFEVGEEVAQKFREIYKNYSSIVHTISESEKFKIDLWEANKIQLLEAGIPRNQIEVSGLCTYSHPEIFFSARRDGFETGRFAVGAALQKL